MTKARLLPPALALVCLMGFTSAAGAEDGSAVRRGLKVVDQWCSLCHSISRQETDPERAPTFAAIMQRDGRNKAYLAAFMEKDHFPMTTYRLFDHEKRDVVAFLLWLKQGE